MSFNVSLPEEIKRNKRLLSEKFWLTRFNFPKEFNGWRPGMIHTFLSNTGGGKSTLAKTIILDAYEMNPDQGNILIWLTEEYKEVWEAHFFRELNPLEFPRLKIFSEKDYFMNGRKSKMEMVRFLIGKIQSENIKLMVLDNITTSAFYKTLDEQVDMVHTIANSFSRAIPKIIFAHTNASFKPYSKEMMDEMHIHGSKELAKISEVFHCLQVFQNGDNKLTFLRNTKNRLHTSKNNFFFLDYDPQEKRYRMDIPRDFESFKSAFKERNQL